MIEGLHRIKGRKQNRIDLDAAGNNIIATGENTAIVMSQDSNPTPPSSSPSSTSTYTVPQNNSTQIIPLEEAQDIQPTPPPTSSKTLPISPTKEEDIVVEFLPNEEGDFFETTKDIVIENYDYYTIGEIKVTSYTTKSGYSSQIYSSYPNPYALNISGPFNDIKKYNLKYNNFVKIFASSIAAVEGWSPTKISSCQRNNNNPGNVRGKGDLKYGFCESGGGTKFAKFSSLEKGWEALIEQYILNWANGKTTVLKYAGATEYVNKFKKTDNEYFKKNGIGYKELDSYSYKSGSPTFRQYFHQYAPWGDGGNSPVQYVANVILTLRKNGIDVKSVDDKIIDYIK